MAPCRHTLNLPHTPIRWQCFSCAYACDGTESPPWPYPPIFLQALFGEMPEKVARYPRPSVLVVKQYEGHVRSMFKRLFG